jgi:hypothetical protein
VRHSDSKAARPTRLLALLPVVVLGAVVLSACDPRQTGAAAVVGGTRISESVVNQDAQDVVEALGKSGGQVPSTDALLRAQVEFRVDAALVDMAAAKKGIAITQGQVDRLIESSGGRETLTEQFVAQQDLWLPPDQLDALAREFLTQQALGINLAPGKTTDEQGAAATAYVTQLAKDVGVTVSPRYGTFDTSSLRVGALPNDLSVPAGGAGQATASPTPSPSAS